MVQVPLKSYFLQQHRHRTLNINTNILLFYLFPLKACSDMAHLYTCQFRPNQSSAHHKHFKKYGCLYSLSLSLQEIFQQTLLSSKQEISALMLHTALLPLGKHFRMLKHKLGSSQSTKSAHVESVPCPGSTQPIGLCTPNRSCCFRPFMCVHAHVFGCVSMNLFVCICTHVYGQIW